MIVIHQILMSLKSASNIIVTVASFKGTFFLIILIDLIMDRDNFYILDYRSRSFKLNFLLNDE